MDSIRRLGLLLLLLSAGLAQPCAAQDLELSGRSAPMAAGWMAPAERDWLAQRGPLRIGVTLADRAPLQIVTGNRFEGLSADYLELLLGDRQHVQTYPTRQAALDALRQGEVDLVAGGSAGEAAHNGLLHGRSYAPDQPVLVTDEAHPFAVGQPGRTLAVVTGYLTTEQVQAAYPGSNVQLFDTTIGALNALNLGSVDGVLGDALSVHYQINMNYLFNLHIDNFAPIDSGGFGFLLRPGDERLRDLLDQGLARVGALRREEILRRWSAGERLHLEGQRVVLTPREQRWLDAHPTVPVVINRFTGALIQADADGRVSGILRDYLDLLAQRSGLRFSYLVVDDYNQMEQAFTSDRALLTPVVTPGVEGLDLLPPYLRASVVLVTAKDDANTHSLADMNGKRLSTAAGRYFNQTLRERYPQVRLVEAANQQVSLDNVAEGRADAAISSLFSVRPQLADEFAGRLRIAGLLEDLSTPFSMGVHQGQPELFSMLDKAQLTVDPEELSGIVQRWGTRRAAGTDFWHRYRQTLLGVAGIAALLVALSLVWGFYLQRQVRRTRKAEQGLSEQLELLSELIEAIPNPVFRLDREGRMSLCNQALLRLFDCRLEDCQGKSIVELGWFAPEEGERLLREHREQVASGRMSTMDDQQLRLRDRECFVYRWAVAQRDAEGTIQGVIGGWVDLTERHQLMRQLEAERQRADAANSAKSQFLSAMSHEIRTPMNAIIGLQELVLEKARGGTLDHASLEVAQDAARSLLMLIGNVLDMARIESGHVDSAPTPAHLHRQLDGSVSLFLGLALQKGLKLELVAGEPLDCWVLLDVLRFKQVLFNLLNNAIKFTEHGGVTVRATASRSGERLDLQVEVIDSGIGISAEDQAGLFRPFAQVEQPASQVGSGLGLHISRRLVEVMGGSLDLRSELGHGSCFSIRLPLVLASAPREEPNRVPQPSAQRALKVLAVDDHPANRLVFQQQLEHLGHQATLASGGHQALEDWLAGDYDVVLTDCRMSGGDGYELSRRIREQEQRMERPRCLILGATANAQDEVIRSCLDAGMDDVLFKPLTLEVLRQALLGARPGDPVAAGMSAPEASAAVFTLEGLFGADPQRSDAAREFVRTLLEANEQDLEGLRQLRHAGKPGELGELAHRLAGVAAIICAHEVETRCRDLQATLRANDGSCVEAQVDVVMAAVSELQQHLRQWLAQVAG